MWAWFVACGLALAGVGSAAAFDVNACGQSVPVGERAVLTADLSCNAGDGPFGVEVAGAFLDLDGHTITVTDDIVGVSCRDRCWVGYGTISGGSIGVQIDRRAMLVALNLVGPGGVTVSTGVAGRVPLSPYGRLTALNLFIIGHEVAVADVGKILGSTLAATGCGDLGTGGDCVSAYKKIALFGLQVLDSQAQFTARAISGTVNLDQSQIINGTGTGVQAARMRLRNSNVTGNLLDLSSLSPPRLVATTCNTSNGWSVCTDD